MIMLSFTKDWIKEGFIQLLTYMKSQGVLRKDKINNEEGKGSSLKRRRDSECRWTTGIFNNVSTCNKNCE
jgi:hypothetical protein